MSPTWIKSVKKLNKYKKKNEQTITAFELHYRHNNLIHSSWFTAYAVFYVPAAWNCSFLLFSVNNEPCCLIARPTQMFRRIGTDNQ